MVKIGGRSKSSKSIIGGGDVHDGASTAVCSPAPYRAEQDDYIKPNAVQKTLFSAWETIKDNLKNKKPNLWVCNGEPIDGANRKQIGAQSWTTSLEDQMNDFIKLAKHIPYKDILFTRGSLYHSGLDATNFEEVLADRMGALRYKMFGGGGATDYFANIEVNNKVFNFSHHIGFSKGLQTRAAALSREMANMHYEYEKLGKVDVIVRSHVHYFCHVEFVHSHGIILPAWKYPDGHLFRGGVAGTTPDIGMVEMIVEPNGEIIVNKIVAEVDLKAKVRHI